MRQIIGYLLTFPVCRPDRTGLIASTLLRAACRELFRGPAFVCGLFGLPEPAFGSGGRPSRPRAFSNSVARAGSFHPVVFPSGETSEGKFCGDDSFRPLTGGRLRYRPFRRYGAFPRLVFYREAACRLQAEYSRCLAAQVGMRDRFPDPGVNCKSATATGRSAFRLFRRTKAGYPHLE